MIQHTYEAASRASLPRAVSVATDSLELLRAVHAFGGIGVMTSESHASGTDRVAEVAARKEDVDIVVNLQGDEPEMSGESIDLVIRLLEDNPEIPMSTLATPIRERQRLEDPACVKVVFSDEGQAIYFSRAQIPSAREWNDVLLHADPPHFYQHLGIYAYRREFLLELTRMPQARLETIEKLEQLRVVQAGIPIQVGIVTEVVTGIDTAEDYRAFVRRCRARYTIAELGTDDDC